MTFLRRRPPPGFTLIEFAIVLVVTAILLRLGVPGLARSVASRALSAQASEFMSALRFARAEALKRGTLVTLCASDPAFAQPHCQPVSSSAPDWRGGWLVFVDRGPHGVLGSDDQVLRLQQPLSRSGGVPGTRVGISFTAAGFATDAASHYRFDPPATPGAEPPPSLLVCVSKQGRPRLATTGTCN